MKTAMQIKYERLLRRIIDAENKVMAWSLRPYSWHSQCETYTWECILKHRKAMMKHFVASQK